MHQSFGEIIKLTRIEKSIKQEDLCEGICTPSYLSRIENNRVIADKQVYELLLNKLGIKINNSQNHLDEIDNKIEQWYEQLLFHQAIKINIDELREEARSANDEIYTKFIIVYCRYLLKFNNIVEVKKYIKDLQKTFHHLNTRQQFLLTDILILFYYKSKEYDKAIEWGKKISNSAKFDTSSKPLEFGKIYYNLAYNYRCLFLYEKATYFAKLALTIFNESYYLEFALHCHVLLGICYNNSHKTDEALYSYQSAEKIIPFLPKEQQSYHYSIIENNIGNCYENKYEYNKALQYYIKSYHNSKNDNNMMKLVNIIRCCYKSNNIDQAKHWLEVTLNQADNKSKYFYHLKIYKLILHNLPISIEELKILESDSLNFFMKENMKDSIIFYSKIFARLYKERNLYKKACEMYELALYTLENTKERG